MFLMFSMRFLFRLNFTEIILKIQITEYIHLMIRKSEEDDSVGRTFSDLIRFDPYFDIGRPSL